MTFTAAAPGAASAEVVDRIPRVATPPTTTPVTPRVVAHDLNPSLFDQLYPHGTGADADGVRLVDVRRDASGIADAEVLVTGWGSTPLTPDFVRAHAPRLKLVVHTGGSVREIFPRALYDQGLRVSAQAATNAAPVAQFATAVIVLALKKAFLHRERYRTDRHRARELLTDTTLGLYRRPVGVVGASQIGRLVIENLVAMGARVLLYDPFVGPDEAARLGVELVDDLCSLAASVDLLSIHAPLLDSTRHMIDAGVLACLNDDAIVVNTARGAIVDEDALVAELITGRLSAVLDVTYPEPPAPDSPLWTLPNVFLTPHLAGALGTEVSMLGDAAWGEVRRWLRGEPLVHELAPEVFDSRA